MMGIIKKLIRDFFVIFGLVISVVTILRQAFEPKSFELRFIEIAMLFSLLADLTSLILYTSKEVTDKQMRIRRIIHFFVLESVLLAFGYLGGYVTNIINILILAVEIAVIYIIIRFLSYNGDKNISNQINERLKQMKERKISE